MSIAPCTCGEAHPHPIARAKTIEGKSIILHSDGQVTQTMGYHLRGIGVAREDWAQEADLTAGRALMGEVGLLTMGEAVIALKALRAVCRQPYEASCSWRWAGHCPTAEDTRHIIFKALGR